MTDSSGPADIATHVEDAWNAHDTAAFGLVVHGHATFVESVRD